MKGPSPETPRPEFPSLSTADFERPPAKLEEYKVGDKLTRENLMSFIILSFAVSRGSPTMQKTFFAWLKDKFNFDYYKSLIVFRRILSTKEILTPEEKEKFREAFNRVVKHDRLKKVYYEPEKSLENQLDMMSIQVTVPPNIETLADFTNYVRDYWKTQDSQADLS